MVYNEIRQILTLVGTANDHLQIQTVKITPDPPVLGQNVTVAVTGSLNEDVTSGTLALLIQYPQSWFFQAY